MCFISPPTITFLLVPYQYIIQFEISVNDFLIMNEGQGSDYLLYPLTGVCFDIDILRLGRGSFWITENAIL